MTSMGKAGESFSLQHDVQKSMVLGFVWLKALLGEWNLDFLFDHLLPKHIQTHLHSSLNMFQLSNCVTLSYKTSDRLHIFRGISRGLFGAALEDELCCKEQDKRCHQNHCSHCVDFRSDTASDG